MLSLSLFQIPNNPLTGLRLDSNRGDVSTLRTICADGLLTSLISRISARTPRERFVWKLHKYTKFARVVSNMAARLPLDVDAGQRQAVVRIQSKQSLTKYKTTIPRAAVDTAAAEQKEMEAVPGTGEVKDVREYVVIQKRVISGKEGPWIIWGTTEETTCMFFHPHYLYVFPLLPDTTMISC